MTSYPPEPRTAAEALDRARETARRARPPAKIRVRPPQWQIDGAAISAQMRAAVELISNMTDLRKVVPPIVRAVVASVALETGVSSEVILGAGRGQAGTAARWEAMRRVRVETGASTTMIGRWFNRDHSSVVHALRAEEKPEHRAPRAARPSESYSHTLTREAVEAIRADSRRESVVARDFGVSRRQVGRIKRRECWA